MENILLITIKLNKLVYKYSLNSTLDQARHFQNAMRQGTISKNEKIIFVDGWRN